MKGFFAYIKKIKVNDYMFWIYFGIQYIIPMMLVYPVAHEIICASGCRKDPVLNIIIIAMLIFFGMTKSHFPKKTSLSLKLFIPIIVNASIFLVVYGFANFIESLRVYGIITLGATMLGVIAMFAVSTIKDYIKEHKKKSKISLTKHVIRLALVLVYGWIILIGAKIAFLLLMEIPKPSNVSAIEFNIFVGVSFISIIYSLIRYLKTD